MRDIVAIIRKNPEAYAPALMQQAADEIELLRIGVATALKERDEARRQLCGMHYDTPEGRVAYARRRGWDCFSDKSLPSESDDRESITGKF